MPKSPAPRVLTVPPSRQAAAGSRRDHISAMTSRSRRAFRSPCALLRLLCALVLIALAVQPAAAQLTPETDVETPAAPTDPLGRLTPRGTVTGLIDALAARDYARSAYYFDLPSQDDSEVTGEGAELAQRFQAALDRGGKLLPFAALSNQPSGRIDDGLPVDAERVGAFGGEEAPPILLSLDAQEDGTAIWRISRESIEQLDSLAPPAEALEPGPDDGTRLVGGAPVVDWALLLGIAAGTFFIFWLVSAAILAVMRVLIADHDKSSLYRFTLAALPPFSLFLAVVGFQFWAESVEASIVARQTLQRYIGIVAWVALAWFLLRLVDAIAKVAKARLERQERRQAVSMITLLRRAAKILLWAIALVAILDTFGVDVTAGIAALGIGGIALALGAQKTVENLVGSISVIADRPVQVGDFCRVGDVVGTVEDVGMRSTRIRTLERTIVTIPNGDFASQKIENFAKRDRFLFNPTIGLEYGVSPAKLREGVAIVERVLMEHEKIDSEGARACLGNFGDSSLDIEVFSYITVGDFTESVFIRQELLLAMFERLEAAGLAIAFPTRTVHLVRDWTEASDATDTGGSRRDPARGLLEAPDAARAD